MRTADEILIEARRLPKFSEKFDYLLNKSEQAVIFGSYASGFQLDESDIDILFISKEKNIKTKYLDFICIKPDKLHLKSWLGTELANHVASFGIWIKGDDSWKHEVFISNSSLERKKIIILNRLAHLFVKKNSISQTLMLRLFEDVLLDSYRLIQMDEGCAVPSNVVLINRFINDNRNILVELTNSKYLGKVAEIFIDELFNLKDREIISRQLTDKLLWRKTNFFPNM